MLALLLSVTALTACEKNENAQPAVNSITKDTSSIASRNYALGTSIKFGAGGGSEKYKGEGWSGTEAQMTWTTGKSAKLALSLAPTDDPLFLRIRLAGLTKTPQPVGLDINGKRVADWQVGHVDDFTAAIPAENSKSGGELYLELQTPNATTPKAAGINDDSRVLGVSCFELMISKSN